MSESIRRKGSSKQVLQNLIRVTAQRSQEDAEEVERERRRRSREKERGERSPSWSERPLPDELAHNAEPAENLKPSCCSALDEDEGFSDWTHRLENRAEGEDGRAAVTRLSKLETEGNQQEDEEEEEEEKGRRRAERRQRSLEASPPEKTSINREKVRSSYSSTVFLPQDARTQQHNAGPPTDRTSCLSLREKMPRGGACRVEGQMEQEEELQIVEEEHAAVQTEWRPAGGDQEEEPSFTCEEKQARREEEVEEGQISQKWPVGGSRTEEVSRRSSSRDEEPLTGYGPMSPTFKKLLIQFYPDEVNSRVPTEGKCSIVERTVSLKKSTNSVKKTPPPVAVSKIDKKLEQYTHALEASTVSTLGGTLTLHGTPGQLNGLENVTRVYIDMKVSSKDSRSGSQVPPELTGATEPVASKRNLFEAGDAWIQNAAAAAPSKDADSLKVGVAELINQWVRGSDDGSRCSSPFKPADNSSNKRSRFVVTGHGKYEKIPVDDGCEDTNCRSAPHYYEDL